MGGSINTLGVEGLCPEGDSVFKETENSQGSLILVLGVFRMKAAVLGYGYWGKNITRNFVNILGINNVVIYDPDEKALINARAAHLGIEVLSTAEELFSRSDIDIIAVVTPVSTHYDLGLRALKSGKHLFLEKPMTQWTWQAEELIEEARKQGLVIMVDHTFLFTGAVQKIKEIVEEGVLGEIIYFDSYRVNLGLFQHDVNVIYDLAPHDISILNHLVQKKPIYLQAEGFDFIKKIGRASRRDRW